VDAVANENAGFTVPNWVTDLNSFDRWVDAPEFPSRGRFSFFRGAVWADTGPEDALTHDCAKLWVGMALGMVTKSRDLGNYFGDRVRLRNEDVGFSTEPDGLMISSHSSQAGRIRYPDESTAASYTFAGAPDMVLEVVSDASEKKDREILRDAYYRAGVTEYWIVDARPESPVIDVLGYSARGFVASRHQAGGWVRSKLFGRSFRLLRSDATGGGQLFTLEHAD
jgi:Uma2 family endonuclease